MLMRKECVNDRCSCLCWHELGVAWAESKCVLAQDGKQSCWSYWVGDRDVCGPPLVCQYPVEVRGLICPVVVLSIGLMCVGRGGFNAGALVAESGNARVLATCVVCEGLVKGVCQFSHALLSPCFKIEYECGFSA